MPPKKTGKKGGASSKAKQLKAEQSSTSPALPSPNSTATLDIIAHPYILSLIIEASPRSTLVTFLRCSKEVFKLTAPSLYKHLRLTCKQFETMIATGNAPSKRGSTSGILGRSFSPFLRYALENVTSLHISDHYVKWIPPVVPRGCFASVKHLFVTRTPSWRHRSQDLLSLPTDILSRLPKDVRHVTIILRRSGWGCQYLRSGSLSKLEGFARAGNSVTIVLEPSPHHTFGDVLWGGALDLWTSFSSPLLNSPRRYDIQIVGSRYGTAQGPGHVGGTSSSTCRPSFVEFTEWLAGLEDESIYTANEEVLMRGHDRRIRFKPAPALFLSPI